VSEDRSRRWITLLEAERERRQAAKIEAEGGADPRAWLTAKLEEMGERLSSGGAAPSDPVAVERDLDDFLRRRRDGC
jgi:hypothetical protein